MLNRVSVIEWSSVYAMHVVVSVYGFSNEHSNTDPGKR